MASFDKKMGAVADRLGKKFTDLGKSMSLKVTAPIGIAGGLALRSAAKMETLETAFVGILGSADKASAMVKDLFEFTAKTPFQLEGVAASAKQLLAAGVASEDMTNQLQMLGDISAAANVPLQDMSAIFAKIKNKGKAMTEEILQMSDRGIPIIEILSKEFGVAKEAIFDMASKGQISFERIQKAMQNMTREGGFANKAMILQSKTLGGVLSTLKDNVDLSLGAIGDVFLEDAKKVAVKMIEIAQSIKVFAQENPALVKFMAVVAGIAAVVGPALIVIGQMALGIKAVAAAFGLAKAAVILFNSAMLANPIGLVITAVGGITAAIVIFKEEIAEAITKVKEFFANMNPLNKLGGALSGLKGKFSGIFGGGAQKPMTQQINTNSKFTGNLQVNVKAPEGTTTNLQVPENTAGFNTGVNSVFAGAR